MKNQIAADDLDTQQSGQNVVSQPINLPPVSRSTTEKALLAITITFGFLLFGLGGYMLGMQGSDEDNLVSMGNTSIVPTQPPTIITQSTPGIKSVVSNQQQIKDCISNDLKLAVEVDESWKCEVSTVEPGFGSMNLSNNFFTIEIDNLGSGYGCNMSTNCVHSTFYTSSLIDLQLLTAYKADKYIFGTFKDNTDAVSYGGVKITYTGIGSSKLSNEDKQNLFKIIDSFKRM